MYICVCVCLCFFVYVFYVDMRVSQTLRRYTSTLYILQHFPELYLILTLLHNETFQSMRDCPQDVWASIQEAEQKDCGAVHLEVHWTE